jgi:hypothetical protein
VKDIDADVALLDPAGTAQLVLLGGPDVNVFAALAAGAGPIPWPIRYEGSGGGGSYGNWRVGPHRYGEPGLGYLFLAPLGGSSTSSSDGGAAAGAGKEPDGDDDGDETVVVVPPRLMLVVTGSDAAGFELAASLFPLTSGLTLPDFVVVDQGFKWKGAGGIISAGQYSYDWEISEASGYIRPYFARR